MGSTKRDVRAIAELTCPTCGAPPGVPCDMPSRDGRPRCHGDRRQLHLERHQQDMRVEVVIQYPDVRRNSSVTYNYEDADSRREMGQSIGEALRAGAVVTSRRI